MLTRLFVAGSDKGADACMGSWAEFALTCSNPLGEDSRVSFEKDRHQVWRNLLKSTFAIKNYRLVLFLE